MRVKHWVEFAPDWRTAPMAYWVHVECEPVPWREASSFNPPAPQPLPHKGYAVLCVEVAGCVLRFSSVAQLQACVCILSMRPLPTSQRLSALRGSGHGPNSHWLSRLPARVKSPQTRRKVVQALQHVLQQGTPWDSPAHAAVEREAHQHGVRLSP
jgi:hypothetical protein